MDSQPQPVIVQPITANGPKKPFLFAGVFILLIILSGMATGFGLSKIVSSTGGGLPIINGKTAEVVSTATEEGVKDASAYPDTATGEIKANDGKITSEGSHILVRPGGVSQNVYLTSSIVDLDKYVGKQVQVWGQTFKGQKAGWLMDVGKIKVVN